MFSPKNVALLPPCIIGTVYNTACILRSPAHMPSGEWRTCGVFSCFVSDPEPDQVMACVRVLCLLGVLALVLDRAHSGRFPGCDCHCNVTSCGREQIELVVREELKRPRTGPHDCAEIKNAAPNSSSGVYTVFPNGNSPSDVYCDMETLGGGWLVLQKRYGGFVDFYRSWNDYFSGFGNVDGEHWLGNRKLHSLTAEKNYLLHIGLSDFEGNDRYAQYTNFRISGEDDGFKLTFDAYSGNAGDSLRYHNNRPFSTRDKDNDDYGTSCAEQFNGGWWYGRCHDSNLNGLYFGGTYDVLGNMEGQPILYENYGHDVST